MAKSATVNVDAIVLVGYLIVVVWFVRYLVDYVAIAGELLRVMLRR